MGLVLYALKYRVSFYVTALLVVLAGIGACIVAPKDVLPNVNIPVVVVVWTYNGLDATDMAQRITTYSEFGLSNNVNNIKRMESTTLPGTTIEKIYFQQNVSIDLAIAQVVSSTNSIRAVMPPGVQPPVVMRFSASSVPVIQLSLSSTSESLAKLYDYGQYRIRQTLTQVPGSTLPSPYGGAPRQIMVDLDLHALQAYGLTPQDVTGAITSQNIIVPSGLSKIGDTQYPIKLNASPTVVADLNLVPIKVVNGAPVLIRDVANVRDGAPPQLNIVRTDGNRSILTTILKNGEASTLSVVDTVKSYLPQIRAAAPKDMKIEPLADQSVFVSGAIKDVIREAVIAAALTGAMILLFLGSWRSTLVVLVSIPLAILTSLAVLTAIGESINIMTLGGLALAVGILVDDATVAIENTYRLMEGGAGFRDSVVEGASGIAKPALISTLSICAAFVSVLFLTDAPKFLFTPQALAVVFAMLASYFFSRTLVPILINLLVKTEYRAKYGDKGLEDEDKTDQADPEPDHKPGALRRFAEGTWHLVLVPFRAMGRLLAPSVRWIGYKLGRGHAAFERGFTRFERGYVGLLHAAIAHRLITGLVTGAVLALGAVLFVFVGQDYFPTVDAGAMTLHIRTRPGLRLETTEQRFAQVEQAVRDLVPARDLGLILDNIGLPASNYNFAFSDGSFVAYNDGQMIISLKEGHAPTAGYIKALRAELPARFPDTIFYFQPADIITQILDFGTITPIDVQVNGRNQDKDIEVAQELERRIGRVRGAVDVHIQQITDAPEFFVDVDRRLASEIGLTEQQIANVMNISLSGSYQVQPNFWADPKTGIPYPLWVQTPEYRNDSLQALQTTPLFVTAAASGTDTGPTTSTTPTGTGASAQASAQPGVLSLLMSVSTFRRQSEQTVINHVNTQPTYDILASAQDRDLGAIKGDILKIVAEEQQKLPAPDTITVRGQIESMDNAFSSISIGLGIAIIAVYLLMAVNFQSWGDPFVIIMALPIAFCGILTSLFITQTTLSIPSLFGAIMSVGVASANSILLITFAREKREETGCSAMEAAIAAGETRLRPVLMTAGAMFVGLIPMAIGIGEGSEQNAALARAVLGGVAFGTCSTLLLVPFLYVLMRGGRFQPVEDYR